MRSHEEKIRKVNCRLYSYGISVLHHRRFPPPHLAAKFSTSYIALKNEQNYVNPDNFLPIERQTDKLERERETGQGRKEEGRQAGSIESNQTAKKGIVAGKEETRRSQKQGHAQCGWAQRAQTLPTPPNKFGALTRTVRSEINGRILATPFGYSKSTGVFFLLSKGINTDFMGTEDEIGEEI